MNRRMVFYLLGKILILEAALMSLPLICSAIYGEKKSLLAFAITIFLSFVLGWVLTKINRPKDKTIFAKEGFVIVALTWVAMSLIGALPFVISGEIPNFVDAFF